MNDINGSSVTSDNELIRATFKNVNAYRAIVERYEAPLSRYISRLGCKDGDDVKDVLQEVFIKAYTHLNSFDQGLKFSSWLYRIAHNETISFFRKVKLRPTPLISDDDIRIFEQIPDKVDIARDIENSFKAEEISAALKSIDRKYRDVLILRFIEDKSYEDISDILKIPAGTVATRIKRGKKKLSSALKKSYTLDN